MVLPLVYDSLRFSDRVCNPGGWKIRSLGQLYQFVKATSLTGTLKSLVFSEGHSALSTLLQRHDEMLSRCYVDNLQNNGVKIVDNLSSSGNATVRSLQHS